MRNTDDKMLGGVCAGVADYFGLDATLVRLLTVVGAVFGLGSLVVAYVVAWAVMPGPLRPPGQNRPDDPSPSIGTLTSLPALDHPDLLAPAGRPPRSPPGRAAAEVAVVEIDPELADTAAMSEAYDLPMDTGANCVVVAGRRDGQERVAACVVRADTRADVNNLVKRMLDVRKASFLSMDRAVEESGMEYGGITPVGLPDEWRVLVDRAGARHRRRDHRLRRTPLQAAAARPAAGRAPGAEVMDDLAV